MFDMIDRDCFPQPNDGFRLGASGGERAGAGLPCRSSRWRAHLFTTRPWPLGTRRRRPRRRPGPKSRGRSAWTRRTSMRAHQVHGASVVVRRAGDPPRGDAPLVHADIIVSDDPAIVAGDSDRRLRAAAASPIGAPARSRRRTPAGAAWRRACPRSRCRRSASEFGSRPADLVAAIGPSISGPRYEVGAEVRAQIRAEAGFQPAERRSLVRSRGKAGPLVLRRLGGCARSARVRQGSARTRSISPACARPASRTFCARIAATARRPAASRRRSGLCRAVHRRVREPIGVRVLRAADVLEA